MKDFVHLPAILILTLGASLWAGHGDIKATDFVVKDPMEINHGIPMKADMGTKLIPIPYGSLEPGFLYLRKKVDGTSYSIYKARPTAEAFQTLKTFRPLGGSPQSFLNTKFYATRNTKAFQDESEIYFDQNFIYSSRVPKLFFADNDQWIELKSEVVGMGSLLINANVPAIVYIDGDSVGATPLERNGLINGVHTIKLVAPNMLPIVSGVVIASGQVTRRDEVLPTVPAATSGSTGDSSWLTLDIFALETYAEKEAAEGKTLSDSLALQLKQLETIYPRLMPSPVGVPVGDLGYSRYTLAYKATQAEAQAIYKAALQKNSPLGRIALIQKRLDSLQSLTVNSRVRLEAKEKVDSTNVRLKLRSADGRVDVGWEGAWKDSLGRLDSLVSILQDSAGALHLEVAFQNKSVRIQYDSLVNHRNYRYQKLLLVGPATTLELKGKFLLPQYILDQQEVKDWMYPPVASVKDSSLVQKVAPLNTNVAPRDERPLWIKAYRGDVAEIPGGTFRYKGRMVQMSPYGIQKTEVTQALYQRITLQNPASKKGKNFVGAHLPVTQITWEEADEFCHTIGGKLPSEAQWEFAARAGGAAMELWKVEGVGGKASDFAIYGKQAPADVGTLKANDYGLFDVHGNVSEWTNDLDSWFSFFVDSKDPEGAWTGSDRIFKGGSWKSDKNDLALNKSDYEDPRYWGTELGVRCAFPSQQALALDSIQGFLRKQDSVATAKKIQLLDGPLSEQIK